jgi:hypothetical protein
MNTRGPLAALGVGVPLELGGAAAEVWLALLFAASILAWGVVAMTFGARAALLTTGLLLAYPGYAILFHGLASDSLFAAGFAGWAVLLTRAILRPSTARFVLAGLGLGALVLVRPSNQVLIVMALLPLAVPGSWSLRLRWVASFFVASVALTQGWKALASARWGDDVALKPSGAAVALAAVLLAALLVPRAARRWVALAAVPLGVAVVALAVGPKSPTEYVRTVAQLPAGNPFLFRAFEIEPIMSPENGPASRELGRVVERELLAKEPYRSYGVGLDEFFSSGSNRMFGDLTSLSGVDLAAATNEAIREHRGAFVGGIVRTAWEMLWAKRVYAPEDLAAQSASTGERTASPGPAAEDTVVVDGRTLPAPGEGQPIPASRVGPVIQTRYGGVREVWSSATAHRLVFDDPRDEVRYLSFERAAAALTERLPARGGSEDLVHRLNQASHRFPPPVLWLALGILALAIRRPRHALVALVPSVAALVLVVATALVAHPVGEYAAPVSPAFVLLAAAGWFGTGARGRLKGLSGEAARGTSA